MCKQAIGWAATNYRARFDSTSATLDYPQRPLVSTMLGREMGFDELACGCNAIVAILSWNGYGQEVSGRAVVACWRFGEPSKDICVAPQHTRCRSFCACVVSSIRSWQ